MNTNHHNRFHQIQRPIKRWILLWKIYLQRLINILKIPWVDQETRAITMAVSSFRQSSFTDPETGRTLKYNLFIPKEYDPQKSYPLVNFIHDAGVVSGDPRITLIQGLGGVIWATPHEQSKHSCFVLAPQYSRMIVNDRSEATAELELTVKLINQIADHYSIDIHRIYTTGQSMGCMASIEIMIRHPDLFAAALLVAGQWDPERMAVLSQAKMWITVSEGDQRAYPGMMSSLAALESAGAEINRAVWNGRANEKELTEEARKMTAKGININYSVFKKGTVVPEGLPDDGRNNHLWTWPLVYRIEGLRDWLFSQQKDENRE